MYFIQQTRQTFKQRHNQVFGLGVYLHLSREHSRCNCIFVWQAAANTLQILSLSLPVYTDFFLKFSNTCG